MLAWTEDNQGLVSVAALAFALFWALWENHRANTENAGEIAAFNKAIVDLIDRSIHDLSDFELKQSKHPGNDDFYVKWDRSRGLTRKSLDYLRGAGPPDASLTITLTELDELFEDRLGMPPRLPSGMPPLIGTVDAATFKGLRDKLSAIRTQIEAHQP